jgi:glycosyltransferase involved in cell wall biosynthesis
MPTRFLLVSTHTEQTTGYSKVSHNLLKQLATLHPVVKVFHFGFQRSQARAPKPLRPLTNVVQYDAAANEEPREHGFGFNKLREYIDTVTPDIVMIYNDPIVVNQFLESIKDVPKTFKLWVYLDQVYEGADMSLLRRIENTADRILCFTESWKAHLKSRLTTATLPIDVLEHGVDTLTYKPSANGERIGFRKQIGVPVDATLFINVNRNSQRKRLDLTIMGFARLLPTHPNSYLAIVTGVKPEAGGYYNPLMIFINELKKLGLEPTTYGQRLITIDTTPPSTYYSDEIINQIYGAADIGVNTSNGEGFGLCQLEHMATGAPQVVLDIGGYRAFLDESTGVLIKPSSYEYLAQMAGVGATQVSATGDEVAEAMKKAISMLSPETSAKCINAAKDRPWSKVCDAFLESIISPPSALPPAQQAPASSSALPPSSPASPAPPVVEVPMLPPPLLRSSSA